MLINTELGDENSLERCLPGNLECSILREMKSKYSPSEKRRHDCHGRDSMQLGKA
jgi:hypothetical protein